MLYKFFIGLFLCLCICIDLFADEPVNFAFFNDKPRSLAKDFYIYEYVQSDAVTPKEAKALFGMVHTMNMRFFHLFAKKMDNLEYKKISKCVDLDVSALLKEDDECLNMGINIAKVTSLPKGRLIPKNAEHGSRLYRCFKNGIKKDDALKQRIKREKKSIHQIEINNNNGTKQQLQ
jgi:soluble lytic murein transglycosylase